ncbi:Zinc finger, C6HC-type [Corchorus olitorius]|uniref:RBR-type E3 ubiquitin transferase n=1 Tax=Corchorus olitorius TaxID=93759 RepID=A0A1R3H6L3_9ROSI|nr:Zinc finger, C6HC-type [Corchorus olitorius]
MAQIAPNCDLDFIDEFYYSALFDRNEEEIFPPFDGKYAEELQFQEALMSSAISLETRNNISNPFICHASSSVLIQAMPQPELMETETKGQGESSLSFCEICVERKESDQMFKTETCVHSYCLDCIGKHVLTRVEESITIITCPGVNCKAMLELDACRLLLPEVVIHRWEDALCQEFINGSLRFYCPFRDCSAPLLNDDGGEVIRESECPFCHRLFCAQCSVPWHSGINCEDFQRLNEDERGREDLMVRELAKEKKWARCPKCNFYVERTEGCPHMICR